MATVFEAENVYTTRRVAIKWLRTQDYDSPERVLREAQAATRVRHHNVADIYDVGFEQGAIFLVMELVEGEDLATFLETSSVSVPVFVRLILGAIRGVAQAHRQGVVHRDIKPENIMLARESDSSELVPKIVDFGIAKLVDVAGLTRSGVLIGTPLFMSLEQLRGAPDVDGRADVYAFAVILYTALTGRPPHSAQNLPELVYSITVTDPVSPHILRPELPVKLSQVIMRALARERSDRTASLEQLADELAPFATGEPFASVNPQAGPGTMPSTILVPATPRGDRTAQLPEPAGATRPLSAAERDHKQARAGAAKRPSAASSASTDQGPRPSVRSMAIALSAAAGAALAAIILSRLEPAQPPPSHEVAADKREKPAQTTPVHVDGSPPPGSTVDGAQRPSDLHEPSPQNDLAAASGAATTGERGEDGSREHSAFSATPPTEAARAVARVGARTRAESDAGSPLVMPAASARPFRANLASGSLHKAQGTTTKTRTNDASAPRGPASPPSQQPRPTLEKQSPMGNIDDYLRL